MKRILFLCLLVCALTQIIQAQGVGTWIPYLSYYSTTNVAEANSTVFAVANGSLYSYGKEDQRLKFYSRQNGLSDNGITHIDYNLETKTLLIIYGSGNIDLLSDVGIYNIPYIQTSTNILDPTVNSIYFYKEYAYLSMNFGIVVVNMRKNEITDTYRLNKIVRSICIKGNSIYAATSEGLLSASTDDNLLDANNWKKISLNTDKFNEDDIAKIGMFQNRLCFFVKKKGVYYQDSNNAIQNLCIDSNLNNITVQRDKLLAYTNTRTYICSSLSQKTQVATGTTNDISCQNTSNTYWVASGSDGLVGMKLKGNQMEVFASQLISLEDSPKRNYCDFMTFQQGKLLVAGGGRWANRKERPGTLMVYENGKWTNFDETKIAQKSKVRFSDITSVAVDPNDPTHYFASTWGEGVYEFKDNEYVKLHNRTNSTLASATSDASLNYTRVEGLCYDKKGNLWMTNTATASCINILKNDGTWSVLKSNQYNILNNQSLVDKILITSKGHKWVNIPREDVSIIVFDDKGTIDDTSDDVVNKITSFNLNKPTGEAISVSGYFCMAEDKNGTIWIGTNRGPIICPVPDKAINDPENVYCTRIIRSIQDDIPTYFLDNTKVTAIAVDGGNRKWLGTEGNGVFLVNEDGSETIENFTTENSPLPSNKINSIAINDQTGEIFFGTENGIISYMSDASEGKDDYSEVYAYPNPVRPEYADQVTITGLMTDSNVKITDLNGNIIFQAKSSGGQLTWNCRSINGNRVASGVYLVLSSTPEAKESVVTKIMVIK